MKKIFAIVLTALLVMGCVSVLACHGSRLTHTVHKTAAVCDDARSAYGKENEPFIYDDHNTYVHNSHHNNHHTSDFCGNSRFY